MSSAARELLKSFESLQPADRQEVAAEILRRSMGTEEIAEAGYEEIARGVFDLYDKEESAHGER